MQTFGNLPKLVPAVFRKLKCYFFKKNPITKYNPLKLGNIVYLGNGCGFGGVRPANPLYDLKKY